MDNKTDSPPSSGVLATTARILSWVFHPLFVGAMMMYYLSFIHPTLFLAVPEKVKVLRFITYVNNNVVFPSLVALLMRALGFSRSVQMDDRRERIVPYMASVIFFFWTFHVFRNQPEMPDAVIDMCQGVFLSACCSLVLNSFMKVSMHAVGVGGLLGLMWVLLSAGQLHAAWPMAFAVFLAGIVCTARLLVTDHTSAEITTGLVLGVSMQLLASWL